MSRPNRDSSDHTDIYSGFSPVPENRPRKFGKPFSRPTNCAAPLHRKLDGRALDGFRFPCRSGHVCQHSIPREYAVLVLINQARETDSLPACRCHPLPLPSPPELRRLFVHVIVTRF